METIPNQWGFLCMMHFTYVFPLKIVKLHIGFVWQKICGKKLIYIRTGQADIITSLGNLVGKLSYAVKPSRGSIAGAFAPGQNGNNQFPSWATFNFKVEAEVPGFILSIVCCLHLTRHFFRDYFMLNGSSRAVVSCWTLVVSHNCAGQSSSH